MKKKTIIAIRKPMTMPIQGICKSGGKYVRVGDSVSMDGCGGGKVSSIDKEGDVLIIRKVDDKGAPLRNYGTDGTVVLGGVVKPFVADGAMVPLSGEICALFEDVEVSDEKPQPAQPQNNQQRR